MLDLFDNFNFYHSITLLILDRIPFQNAIIVILLVLRFDPTDIDLTAPTHDERRCNSYEHEELICNTRFHDKD